MDARIRPASPLGIVIALAAGAAAAAAAPGPPPAGYLLARVSDAVPAASLSGISQLAFRPGDPDHLYAARPFTANVVTRYDYDDATGQLSNPLDVTAVLPPPHGIAFRGGALYVSLYTLNDSRLARLRDLDQNGTYEERVDFVRGVPTGDHAMDQLQIHGSSLYVGIGLRKNSGRPDCENPYTGTVARIADLDQTDYSGTGNALPDTNEYRNPTPVDGKLRRYAYGVRNPFGLRVDAAGQVWLSDNGASYCTTCSSCGNFGTDTPDLFYRDVPVGAKGEFPPAGYPGGGGATMTRFATLAMHAAVAGFAWIGTGPHAGHILLAEYGSTDTVLHAGHDIVRIDPTTGASSPFISGFAGPTDLLADAHGRLLIADNAGSAVYLLTPPGVLDVATRPDAPGRGPRIDRVAPNPSSRDVTIEYVLPAASHVTLRIVDLAGRELAHLDRGVESGGAHSASWLGLPGRPLAAGVYLCRLETDHGSVVRAFVRLR